MTEPHCAGISSWSSVTVPRGVGTGFDALTRASTPSTLRRTLLPMFRIGTDGLVGEQLPFE